MKYWICNDKNRCSKSTGKPASKTESCSIPSECVDNDRDGYGVGKDCLGIDLDDNDITITNEIPPITPPEPTPSNVLLPITIGISVLVIVILAGFLVWKYKRGRKIISSIKNPSLTGSTGVKKLDFKKKEKFEGR